MTIDYDLSSVDIQLELYYLHRRNTGSKILAGQDTKYIDSFVTAAEEYAVADSSLVKGESYFLIDFLATSTPEKNMTVFLTLNPLKYSNTINSRLHFFDRHNEDSIYFPRSEYVTRIERRFTFSTREQFDQIVNLLILKFKGADWNLTINKINKT